MQQPENFVLLAWFFKALRLLHINFLVELAIEIGITDVKSGDMHVLKRS